MSKRDQDSKGLFSSGNRVNTTHGLHGYLATGSLPRGASYIRRQLAGFRKALEAAVLDQYGEIAVYRAALVQTAIRHEARASLLQRWLRQRTSELSHADQVTTLKEIGAASDARDKAIRNLGLDQETGILESLYSVTPSIEPQSDHSENFHQPLEGTKNE